MSVAENMLSVGEGHGSSPAFIPNDQLIGLGIGWRREREEDLSFLCSLYVSMRWDEVLTISDWTDDQRLDFLESQFRAQRSHYLQHYHGADFLILTFQGEPVGRIYLFRNSREIRVVDIGFLPQFRNRGWGREVLESLFAEARQSGRLVSAHVEHYNPAQRLYQRLGFRRIKEEGPYHLLEWSMEDAAA